MGLQMNKLPVILAALLTGAPCWAEAQLQNQSPAILNWLRREPISLIDWGLFRAKVDMEKAVARLNEEMVREEAADPMSLSEYRNQPKSTDPEKKVKPWFSNPLGLRRFKYKYRFG